MTWHEGVLNVAAEYDEEIAAEYRDGTLGVRLPIYEGATARGTQVEVQT